MKCAVSIIETLKKKVIIEADDPDDALDQVRENYNLAMDDYILTSEDYVETSFEIDPA